MGKGRGSIDVSTRDNPHPATPHRYPPVVAGEHMLARIDAANTNK